MNTNRLYVIANAFAERCDLLLRVRCIILAAWRDDRTRHLVVRNAARSFGGQYLVCHPVRSGRQFLASMVHGLELRASGKITGDLFDCLASHADTDPPPLFLDDAEHLQPRSVMTLVQLHKRHEHLRRQWPMVLASGREGFFKRMEGVCDDGYVLDHCAYFNPDGFPAPRATRRREAVAQISDDILHPVLPISPAIGGRQQGMAYRKARIPQKDSPKGDVR